ncbi:hypothetical protein XENORESO_006292 [Xenotaenia resolanae]|uniref:Uncharacterized protein n=1 Tax=Xenotaenia resolanae TaxID=208358 RepID=A0ABV0X4A7_9TELE
MIVWAGAGCHLRSGLLSRLQLMKFFSFISEESESVLTAAETQSISSPPVVLSSSSSSPLYLLCSEPFPLGNNESLFGKSSFLQGIGSEIEANSKTVESRPYYAN